MEIKEYFHIMHRTSPTPLVVTQTHSCFSLMLVLVKWKLKNVFIWCIEHLPLPWFVTQARSCFSLTLVIWKLKNIFIHCIERLPHPWFVTQACSCFSLTLATICKGHSNFSMTFKCVWENVLITLTWDTQWELLINFNQVYPIEIHNKIIEVYSNLMNSLVR